MRGITENLKCHLTLKVPSELPLLNLHLKSHWFPVSGSNLTLCGCVVCSALGWCLVSSCRSVLRDILTSIASVDSLGVGHLVAPGRSCIPKASHWADLHAGPPGQSPARSLSLSLSLPLSSFLSFFLSLQDLTAFRTCIRPVSRPRR